MKLPNEMELHNDLGPYRVRFDYYPGEPMRWNGLTGVGNPASDPSVAITEVNFGRGWESPDVYHEVDWSALESEVMEKLAELEAEDYAARHEREYD
jgi:hypothetical protein